MPLIANKKAKQLFSHLPFDIHYAKYREDLTRLSKELGFSVVSHDARRLFATLLAEQCKDITIVREALGHSSVAMTERYVKVSHGRVKDAVLEMFDRE